MPTASPKRTAAKKTAEPETSEVSPDVEGVSTEVASTDIATTGQSEVSRQILLEQLTEPFPSELLKTHPAKRLTYVPVAEVIARMNRVLGQENWRSEIIRVWREPDHPGWVLAHVKVTARINGTETTRDGVGGQQVKMLRDKSGAVDLGDEYKGAVSDALKKACQGLGVGLELARSDEALSYEFAATEQAAAMQSPPPDRVTPETLAVFQEHVENMGEEEKKALKEWWRNNVGGQRVDISTESQVQLAITECVKILLSGSSD